MGLQHRLNGRMVTYFTGCVPAGGGNGGTPAPKVIVGVLSANGSGSLSPRPPAARWLILLPKTLYQLGMYVNPNYTLIAVGFALHDCLACQQAGRPSTAHFGKRERFQVDGDFVSKSP